MNKGIEEKKLATYKPKDKNEPDVKITAISNVGLVFLEFSQNMMVPPLKAIQNASVEVYDLTNKTTIEKKLKKWVQALQIRVRPGKLTYDGDLSLTYNITSYQERKMTIQLNFTRAAHISKRMQPDYLEIVFLGNMYYFTP